MQEAPNELKFQSHQFDKRLGRPQFLDLLTLPAGFWHDRRDISLRTYVAKLAQPLVEKIRSDASV